MNLVFIYEMLSKEYELEINKGLYTPIEIEQEYCVNASLFIKYRPSIITNVNEAIKDLLRLMALKDIDLYIIDNDGLDNITAYYIKKSIYFLGELEKRLYKYKYYHEKKYNEEIKEIANLNIYKEMNLNNL